MNAAACLQLISTGPLLMSQSYMVPQKLFATFHITTAVACLWFGFSGLRH